jgi:predicted Zn-dependent protease
MGTTGVIGHLFKRRLSGAACVLFLLSVFSLVPQIPLAAQGWENPSPWSAADRSIAENSGFSPEDIYFLGRAVAADIISRYPLYKRDTTLNAYLNAICGILVINSPAKAPAVFNGYHVRVLDTAEINAFASPAGHIFVTRGLVSSAPSEDALAAALAHEIAHIQLEHAAAMLADRDISLMLELNEVARQSREKAARLRPILERIDSLQESARAMGNALFTNGYSWRQEFEADIYALSLLRAAGYQASALTDLLKALQQKQSFSRRAVYSAHPSPALRINNIQSRSGGRPVNTAVYRENRFREMIR